MTKHIPNSEELAGCAAVFASAFCFYLSTAAIRWSSQTVKLDPAFFVFVRLLIGFVVICAVLCIRKQRLRPRKYHLLAGRMIANCIAVYCFYKAVQVTSAAEANILNMTYPLYLAIFSWIFLKSQRSVADMVIAGIACAGIWLILQPARMTLILNHIWGLASGISAAAAIMYLNISRRFHDSETILFYMFGLGAPVIFIIFHEKIFLPNTEEVYYLLLCAGFGIGGQYLLTLGFLYVTAVEGGIISSVRILLAAILGPVIASEPALSLSGWIGAILIFGANICLAARKIG